MLSAADLSLIDFDIPTADILSHAIRRSLPELIFLTAFDYLRDIVGDLSDTGRRGYTYMWLLISRLSS